MANEFTAKAETGDDGCYIGHCPEIPGENGQGRTVEECKENLAEAIELILEDSIACRGAIRGTIELG